MAHSCYYPCTFKLHESGNLRTLGSCEENFEAWTKDGSKSEKAKFFKNCIHKSVFNQDKTTEIIDIVISPELHLLIGIVNHLVKHMLSSSFQNISLAWIKACNVSRDVRYGDQPCFAGNSCKTLLDNIDKLRSMCNRINIACLDFVTCFDYLKKVVDSCFLNELDPNYQMYINQFKTTYLNLNISVTPWFAKVHAVFYHVAESCKKTGRGLGYYSEQAMESVHHDFNELWKRFKVDINNARYGCQLLKAVSQYNSFNV
ncbi:unnamed protein product [Brassicogethes aeneus]|uniref:Uncharacterized protein n=1 Tax=Brassicogethes aeneus TaxID=1431903 RepID=A0A9P0BER1_BRAAE|nr:unnamed protein product [Brassicogethes aeneus]